MQHRCSTRFAAMLQNKLHVSAARFTTPYETTTATATRTSESNKFGVQTEVLKDFSQAFKITHFGFVFEGTSQVIRGTG